VNLASDCASTSIEVCHLQPYGHLDLMPSPLLCLLVAPAKLTTTQLAVSSSEPAGCCNAEKRPYASLAVIKVPSAQLYARMKFARLHESAVAPALVAEAPQITISDSELAGFYEAQRMPYGFFAMLQASAEPFAGLNARMECLNSASWISRLFRLQSSLFRS